MLWHRKAYQVPRVKAGFTCAVTQGPVLGLLLFCLEILNFWKPRIFILHWTPKLCSWSYLEYLGTALWTSDSDIVGPAVDKETEAGRDLK